MTGLQRLGTKLLPSKRQIRKSAALGGMHEKSICPLGVPLVCQCLSVLPLLRLNSTLKPLPWLDQIVDYILGVDPAGQYQRLPVHQNVSVRSQESTARLMATWVLMPLLPSRLKKMPSLHWQQSPMTHWRARLLMAAWVLQPLLPSPLKLTLTQIVTWMIFRSLSGASWAERARQAAMPALQSPMTHWRVRLLRGVVQNLCLQQKQRLPVIKASPARVVRASPPGREGDAELGKWAELGRDRALKAPRGPVMETTIRMMMTCHCFPSECLR